MKLRISKFIVSLSIVVTFCSPAAAVILELGIDPLATESGARAIGMGSAFSSISDVRSLFYNPAGISEAQGMILTLQDSNNVSLAQVYPIGLGNRIGLGIVGSYYKLPNQIGETEYLARFIVLGWGTNLEYTPFLKDFFKGVSLGITYKSILSAVLRETGQEDKSCTGWDMDAGATWKPSSFLTIGFLGKNLLPEDDHGAGQLRWDSDETDSIPASGIISAAFLIEGENGYLSKSANKSLILTTDIDMALKYKRPGFVRLGLEWKNENNYIVRLGVDQGFCEGEVITSLTAGLGIKLDEWAFDLGYKRDPLLQSGLLQLSISYSPWQWQIEKMPPKMTEAEEAKTKQYLKTTSIFKIEATQPEVVTYDESIVISGEAKPGAKVFINNSEAYIDNEGKFTSIMPLKPGKNLILIEGRVDGDKVFTAERKILRKAKVIIAEEKEIEKKEQELAKAKAEIISTESRLLQEQREKTVTEQRKNEIQTLLQAMETEKNKISSEETSVSVKKKAIKESKQMVENLVTMGVVEVAPDSEFKLQALVSRGELVSWLVKAAGIPLPKVEKDIFLDVKKDHPYAPYIKAAVDLGLISGYADGTFKPDASLTEADGEQIFKKFGVIK